jgi:hypothetical protein
MVLGYGRFLELLRATSESEVRPNGKLSWLAEYELLDGQPGSYAYHHAEHRKSVEAWMRERAKD